MVLLFAGGLNIPATKAARMAQALGAELGLRTPIVEVAEVRDVNNVVTTPYSRTGGEPRDATVAEAEQYLLARLKEVVLIQERNANSRAFVPSDF